MVLARHPSARYRAAMFKRGLVLISLILCYLASFAQAETDNDFRVVLPTHPGQLEWSAKGFTIVESSAKPSDDEIGIRGKNDAASLQFVGFLVHLPDDAPLTSAKCREGFLKEEKENTIAFMILKMEEITRPGAVTLSLTTYTSKDQGGKTWYNVRGFLATRPLRRSFHLQSASDQRRRPQPEGNFSILSTRW